MSGDKSVRCGCRSGNGGTTYWSARSFELSLQCPDLAHPQRDLFCSQNTMFLIGRGSVLIAGR